MITKDEGHKYELQHYGNEGGTESLTFIKKTPNTATNELLTEYDGTTNEEVLRVLIDRLQYLQTKFPCRENSIVITKLEESLMWLDKRATDREKRGVLGKNLA